MVAHGEYQFNHGEGFDTLGRGGSDGGLNRAYVTWAGLTAGKIDSFFSFTGGGFGYPNFFSADRKGFDQPDLLAYTASFGGGFSATISAESPAWIEDQGDVPTNYANVAATPLGGGAFLGSATRDGMRFPDIVGALDVKQAWGAAHLAGVGHNVRATSVFNGGQHEDIWGYGIDAGVSFNLPNMAGSLIGVTGSWSRNAIVASGLVDGMWGEEGGVNGNGQAMATADSFANRDGTWATPEAWSVTGYAQFVINPQVTIGIEGSYGELHWSGKDAARFAALQLEELPGRRRRSLRPRQEPRLRNRASVPEHPDGSPDLHHQRWRTLERQRRRLPGSLPDDPQLLIGHLI